MLCSSSRKRQKLPGLPLDVPLLNLPIGILQTVSCFIPNVVYYARFSQLCRDAQLVSAKAWVAISIGPHAYSCLTGAYRDGSMTDEDNFDEAEQMPTIRELGQLLHRLDAIRTIAVVVRPPLDTAAIGLLRGFSLANCTDIRLSVPDILFTSSELEVLFLGLPRLKRCAVSLNGDNDKLDISEALTALPATVTFLMLRYAAINPSAMRHIAQYNKIHTAILRDCKLLDDSFQIMSQKCASLEVLGLSFTHLGAFPGFERVSFTDRSADLSRLRQLELLDHHYFPLESLQVINECSPLLEKFRFAYGSLQPNPDVHQFCGLLKQYRHLKTLDIRIYKDGLFKQEQVLFKGPESVLEACLLPQIENLSTGGRMELLALCPNVKSLFLDFMNVCKTHTRRHNFELNSLLHEPNVHALWLRRPLKHLKYLGAVAWSQGLADNNDSVKAEAAIFGSPSRLLWTLVIDQCPSLQFLHLSSHGLTQPESKFFDMLLRAKPCLSSERSSYLSRVYDCCNFGLDLGWFTENV